MSDKTDAQDALFREIKRLADAVPQVSGKSAQITYVRSLALAYRYAAGGAQPGNGSEQG